MRVGLPNGTRGRCLTVCAGVAARGRAGAMIGEGFVEMAQRIGPLVRLGHSALDGGLDGNLG